MSRIVASFILLSSMAFAVPAFAQHRTADFTGTWAMDMTRSVSTKADDRSPALPTTLVISELPQEVWIDTERGGDHIIAKYPRVGEEDVRPVGTGGVGVGSILRWEDGALVTMTPRQINGMTVTTVERRSLSADGKEMTVVTTIEVQHGYQDKATDSTPAQATDVYRRVQ